MGRACRAPRGRRPIAPTLAPGCSRRRTAPLQATPKRRKAASCAAIHKGISKLNATLTQGPPTSLSAPPSGSPSRRGRHFIFLEASRRQAGRARPHAAAHHNILCPVQPLKDPPQAPRAQRTVAFPASQAGRRMRRFVQCKPTAYPHKIPCRHRLPHRIQATILYLHRRIPLHIGFCAIPKTHRATPRRAFFTGPAGRRWAVWIPGKSRSSARLTALQAGCKRIGGAGAVLFADH